MNDKKAKIITIIMVIGYTLICGFIGFFFAKRIYSSNIEESVLGVQYEVQREI